jgi:hypothetical protein
MISRVIDHLGHMVRMMTKLSPRDAVKAYQVSRATLAKALQNGKISAEKTDAGHWQIDAAELRRVYAPRTTGNPVYRTKPEQVNRHDTGSEPAPDHALALRLARAEAALDAEREKTALLQRNLDDLRRMLPPPDAKLRRRWWPW